MCHDHINPVTPHLESFSPLLGSFLFPKHYPIYVHVFENISDSTYEREHVYLSFWVWFVWVSKMVSNLHGFLKIMQHWSSWTKFQCVCWGTYMSGECMGGRFFIHICCRQVGESQRHSDTCSKHLGIYWQALYIIRSPVATMERIKLNNAKSGAWCL